MIFLPNTSVPTILTVLLVVAIMIHDLGPLSSSSRISSTSTSSSSLVVGPRNGTRSQAHAGNSLHHAHACDVVAQAIGGVPRHHHLSPVVTQGPGMPRVHGLCRFQAHPQLCCRC